MDDAATYSLLQRQSAVAEDAQHGRVIAEHVCLEPCNPVLSADVCELPKEPTRDPATLMVFRHDERDVRVRAAARTAAQ